MSYIIDVIHIIIRCRAHCDKKVQYLLHDKKVNELDGFHKCFMDCRKFELQRLRDKRPNKK